MGDWADEVEDSLLKENADGDYVYVGVAAALRQARADALEEAAQEAMKWDDPFEDNPGDGLNIAAAIRALKDKPTCG